MVGQDLPTRRLGISNIRCITHTWRIGRLWGGVGEGSGGGSCEERVEVGEGRVVVEMAAAAVVAVAAEGSF